MLNPVYPKSFNKDIERLTKSGNYNIDKVKTIMIKLINEEILDPKYFFRINRQFIVNIDSIENMHIVSKSRIKLDLIPKPEEEVIVSVNHVSEFKLWLNKWEMS